MNSNNVYVKQVTDGVVKIVAAYLGRQSMELDKVPIFIDDVSQALIRGFVEAREATRGGTAVALALAAAERPSVKAPAAQDGSEGESVVTVTESEPVAEAVEPSGAEEEADATQEADVEPEEPVVPVAEENRFKDLPRETWNGMDPEDAVHPDYIVCLFDGVKRKMLHRHIRQQYKMEAADYIAHFGLRPDYPMTAANYRKEKSLNAKAQGFGKSKGKPAKEAPATPATPAKVARRSRTKVAEAA